MYQFSGFKPGTIGLFRKVSGNSGYDRKFQDIIINYVKTGVRDGRLPDCAIILLDGMKGGAFTLVK